MAEPGAAKTPGAPAMAAVRRSMAAKRTWVPRRSTAGPDGCVPICDGRECGNDGCGGACGVCLPGFNCSAGVCLERGGQPTDCEGIADCVHSCDDERCWEECVSEGAPAAQREFEEVLNCIQEECSAFSEDPERFQQCQIDECGDVLEECLGYPIGGGDMPCDELVECVLDCGGDDGCQEECWSEASPVAREAFGWLAGCSERACSDVDSIPAWEECPEEFMFCFEEEGPPPIPVEGACNEEDWARLEDLGEEMAFVVHECTLDCRDTDRGRRCIGDCVSGSSAISFDCGMCFADLGMCTARECGRVCDDDPLVDACMRCQEEACAEDLYVCVGFEG